VDFNVWLHSWNAHRTIIHFLFAPLLDIIFPYERFGSGPQMFESKVQHGHQSSVVNGNGGKTRLATGRILH
jgi:hypothetical protein